MGLACFLGVAEEPRTLSSLWVFASLNCLCCDVVGLVDSRMLTQYETGRVDDLGVTSR